MKDITLKELQRLIKEVDTLDMGDSKKQDRYFLKLMEEIGELSKCIRKDKRMIENNIKDTIEEELYDTLYYIICIANTYDIDLQKAIYLKEELNSKKYNRKNICDNF